MIHQLAAAERVHQRTAINVFEFTTHWHTVCDAADTQSPLQQYLRLQLLCHIPGSSFALYCRVGGEDYFLHSVIAHTLYQGGNAELLGTDAINTK